MQLKFIRRIRQYLTSDSDRSEVLGGASSAFLLKVGGTGIGYLFNLLLARVFGASILGAYSLTITIVSIAQLLARFGTETSSVRFIADAASREASGDNIWLTYRTLQKFVVPLSLLAGVVLYLMAPWLTHLFESRDIGTAVRIVAVTVPLGATVGLHQGCLRGLKKIQSSLLHRSFLPPLLNLVGVAGLLAVGQDGALTPIYAYTATYAALAGSSFVVWYRAAQRADEDAEAPAEIQAAPQSQTVDLREVVSVSGPLLITAAMHFVMGWTDEIVLGIYATTDDVGVYRIAYKIAMVTGFTLQAVNSITAPKISEFYTRNSEDKLYDLVRLSSALIFWTSVPVLTGFLVLPDWILSIFGDEFTRASSALVLLCMGQFVASACGPVGYMLTMTKYETVFQWVLVFGASLNVGLNVLLVPNYGVLGAAIATMTSLASWNLLASALAYRKFGYWVGYVPSLFRSVRSSN
jgi:O-antigen/teichoic acid export membrane protein